MLDGATRSRTHAYNAQAAVDCNSQVIASADVTQQADDSNLLIALLEQIEENLAALPDRVMKEVQVDNQ